MCLFNSCLLKKFRRSKNNFITSLCHVFVYPLINAFTDFLCVCENVCETFIFIFILFNSIGYCTWASVSFFFFFAIMWLKIYVTRFARLSLIDCIYPFFPPHHITISTLSAEKKLNVEKIKICHSHWFHHACKMDFKWLQTVMAIFI